MLRASLLRARPAALRPMGHFRMAQRFFADEKNLGETRLPNPAPLTTPADPGAAASEIRLDNVPKTPPSAPSTAPSTAPAASTRSAPTVPPAPTPPTGPGSASIAPDPRPPKPKRRRVLRAVLWLALLSTLGYAGGVWYSLVSDNFHDFFTEYIPFAEDAVGYFEEREFRKRFPGRAGQPRLQPQLNDDSKITIPSQSGLGARVADEDSTRGSHLSTKGPHVSAVTQDASPKEHVPPKVGSDASASAAQGVPEKKKEAKETPTGSASHSVLHKDAAKPEDKKEEAPAPAPVEAPALSQPISHIDHLNVPDAGEPVVQDVVKIVNDLITAINADSAHGNKYNSALEKAKSDLSKVVADLHLLKNTLEKSAEERIQSAHSEFDAAAKDLVRRLEVQMHDQETRWKEEYEGERERLSHTYKEKLQSELDVVNKVYEQRLKNELLKQSIALQKHFSSAVRDRVEAERDGRLGKLNELSSSVHELEKLTAEWNSVVDANLKTQHLVVAVEAVKSALENQITPRPFTTELAALKEIAANDPVVTAAIASINPAAYQRGIPNSGQLIDRFRRVAQEVRKAALLPEDAGVASHLASLAMSKVLFKKSGLAVGQDVEAVLARTEVLLEEGDLDGAAREMNSLHGWAKVLSKDWLSDCRKVLEVKQALDVIAAEARLQTLLVD